MKIAENKIDTVYEEMLLKGLLSNGSSWIEKAAAQKSASLPLSIAQSRLLTYDLLDRSILGMSDTSARQNLC
jgi:hypothetical protein